MDGTYKKLVHLDIMKFKLYLYIIPSNGTHKEPNNRILIDKCKQLHA